MFAAGMFDRLFALPENRLAVIVPEGEETLPTLILPLTISDDNVPVLVIFGCAAVVNVPARSEAPIVPELA